jgi:sugar lactone lactonase YvrE
MLQGLLRVTREKEIEVLATEIDGLKFKITDGVDIAHDGTIYFTDASYKYSVKDSMLDILEGNPNGRFLSYNPTTKKTTLLASDLYFPNGVAVSPDQQFVVFCETVL